jgi:membrane protein DedA with SNARE-associated domain
VEGLQYEVSLLLNNAVERFAPSFSHYGLLVVFVLVMLEGCGIPAPGVTILVVGGLLAGRGQMDIVSLLATAWLAVVSGGMIGYLIGRYGGSRLLRRLPIQGVRLQRIEGYFVRNTIMLLVTARFIEGLKQTASIVAGTLVVPLPRFILGTLAGSTVWVAVFGLGSYILDRDFAAIYAIFHYTRPWFWGGLALLIGMFGLALWKGYFLKK